MFTVGARVRLKGLQAKPELNGREGLCKDFRPETGRWTVCLERCDSLDAAEVAIKVPNLDLIQPVTKAGPVGAQVDVTPPRQAEAGSKYKTVMCRFFLMGTCGKGTGCTFRHGDEAEEKNKPPTEAVLEGLDELISQLERTRQSVCEVMIYCMDYEAKHGAALARRLVAALSEPGLDMEVAIARLFIVSDVLHNSGCRRGDGGAKFGASFQELLPEAFEQLGRLSLRSMGGVVERVRAEEAVLKVLRVWQDWGIFPLMFTKGLESLLMAPIYDTSAKDSANEPDARLRQKLLPWFSGVNQAQLPLTCRMRGLSGKSLSTAACRVRLCHFERYWHLTTGMHVTLHGLQAAGELNGCVGVLENWQAGVGRWNVQLRSGQIKAVKPENIMSEEGGDDAAQGSAASSTAPAEVPRQPDESSIDGEPLTRADWLAVEAAIKVEEAARKKALEGRCDLGGRRPKAAKSSKSAKSGTWTQVWDARTEYQAVPPPDDNTSPRRAMEIRGFKQQKRFDEGNGSEHATNSKRPRTEMRNPFIAP